MFTGTKVKRRHPGYLPPAKAAAWGVVTAAGLLGCQFDRADRWDDLRATPTATCDPGDVRCTARLETCTDDGRWAVSDDCAGRGLVCAPTLARCALCFPDERTCDGQTVLVCDADGDGRTPVRSCDGNAGEACRSGSCSDLCAEAATVKSNVGCEYWAVDLDNANIDATSNAAAQQYAVVVSNAQPDLTARVSVSVDDAEVGEASRPREVASAEIPPRGLRVFRLGPREVDGSAPGTFDTGPGTAHTRQAYRVSSHVPVVAYQFNPLDNVNVFSNDASLLKPAEALPAPGPLAPAYVVMGWPQTIAITDDPDTNFNPYDPIQLRAFLTVVGTRPDTRVRVTSATHVVGGDGIEPMSPSQAMERVLQPFEVLNLETGDFGSDFTGSLVEADGPVVVFSGAEAADVPYFDKLANRSCCADHLEAQLDPIRTAGTTFLASLGPNRSRAVGAAGAEVSEVSEPQYFRVLAVSDEGPTTVRTNLPAPDDAFDLPGRGASFDLVSEVDFALVANRPVVFASLLASQDACGVQRPLPGGDPSLVIVPPVEQYRPDYVFLTPDKYAFDFIVIATPPDAAVTIDGRPVGEYGCATGWVNGGEGPVLEGAPEARVYRCQLSFPTIDPTLPPDQGVFPGQQNDGVHRVTSDRNVGVLVYGFDERVSYGYAAGTRLEALSIRGGGGSMAESWSLATGSAVQSGSPQ